jgi:hypothetical protein
MQVTIQIGKTRDFHLKQAILIYEDQVSQREKFATVHRVLPQEPEKQASLGPGNLLTTEFLESLYRGLERAPRAVLLPENVLRSSRLVDPASPSPDVLFRRRRR